jgi:hypothetical protein
MVQMKKNGQKFGDTAKLVYFCGGFDKNKESCI